MALLNHEGMVKWYILQFDYLSLAPVIVALAFLLNSRGFHLLLVQIIPTLKKKVPLWVLTPKFWKVFPLPSYRCHIWMSGFPSVPLSNFAI